MPSPEPSTAARAEASVPTRRRGGRRSKRSTSERVRYFIAKPGSKDGTLTLDQEVPSEPEALVAAFKSDSRVFVVIEYTVVQKIDGNNVALVKEPVAPTQRVSTTNAS